MSTILAAVIPVFIVAGVGYVLRRSHNLDAKTLSTLNLYLFVPALVFMSISQHEIEWTLFARVAVASLATFLIMWALLGGIASRRGLTGGAYGAFLLTMFMNLGNFGLPVCKFAFGDEGLAYAVVVLVCGSFLQNSAGIYFATRSRLRVDQALLRVFQYPLIYAFAAALIAQRIGWQPPSVFSRAVEITAGAAIPVQLMILGIQLAETRLDTSPDVFLAGGIRLVAAPVLAVGVAWLVGLEGLAAKIFILQMSGPVAVGMAAYGVQFDVAPRFLSSVVSWTFLLSIVSVSVVLYFLL